MKTFEMEQMERAINHDLRMRRRVGCKNIDLRVKLNNELLNEGYEITNVGCQNERRAGSAYCQGCSDANKRARGIIS